MPVESQKEETLEEWIREMEKRASDARIEKVRKLIDKALWTLEDDHIDIAWIKNAIFSEDTHLKMRQKCLSKNWLVCHYFTEQEAEAWARIIEWILWIDPVIPSYFVRNYTETPIFWALQRIRELLTTGKIYEELDSIVAVDLDEEEKKHCVRLDDYSVKIIILALEELMEDLDENGVHSEYRSIVSRYKEFLEESPSYA